MHSVISDLHNSVVPEFFILFYGLVVREVRMIWTMFRERAECITNLRQGVISVYWSGRKRVIKVSYGRRRSFAFIYRDFTVFHTWLQYIYQHKIVAADGMIKQCPICNYQVVIQSIKSNTTLIVSTRKFIPCENHRSFFNCLTASLMSARLWTLI